MENKKIKAVIFDVGAVLFLAKSKKKGNLLSSFREACLLLKNVNANLEQVYEDTRDIYFKSSLGKISKKETLKRFSEKLGTSPEKTEKAFEEVYRKNTIENEKLYNYALKLKKNGYKIGISSIQFHLSKKILIPKKYYGHFDALQISCEDGLRKPDKKAFEFILKKLKTEPEESLFIDDKQENLDAAEKLGMKAILFKNNRQLIKDLKKLGVKI